MPVTKTAIKAPKVLNEACEYGSAFTRGLRVELPGGITHLLISGTASIGPNGETLYPGDFRGQLWRTYHNLSCLLQSEGACWEDVVRTTCYLRDIERDYAEFNAIRNEFYRALGLDPYPASTGDSGPHLPQRSAGGDRSPGNPCSVIARGYAIMP